MTAASVISSRPHDGSAGLLRDVFCLINACRRRQEFLAGLCELLRRSASLTDLAHFARSADGALELHWASAAARPELQPRADSDGVQRLMERACATGEIQSDTQAAAGETVLLLCAPVIRRRRPPDAIVLYLEDVGEQAAASTAQFAALALSTWHAIREDVAAAEESSTAHPLDALAVQLMEASSRAELAVALADWLQRATRADQAAVALSRDGSSCTLEAISGLPQFDRHSQTAIQFQQIASRAFAPGGEDRPSLAPPRGDRQPASPPPHLRTERLLSADGECVGVALCWGKEQAAGGEDFSRRVLTAGPVVAACLKQLDRSGPRFLSAALAAWRRFGTRRRRAILGIAALAVALILIVPLPCPVKCDCQLQPSLRRYVAAPFDGTLKSTHALPGDVVREGATLAQLCDREIRLQLEGLVAERVRAEKQRDAFRAGHRFGDAQLADLEIERIALKIRLLQDRLANLEIRSPIDGVVVAGELDKATGAPLSVGQTLFEVAPLDEMRVELSVPQEEISHVREGLPVTVRFASLAGVPFYGAVERVRPRAEIREEQNVFVAEMQLDNRQGLLRPGMKGKATVRGPYRSLAWRWLRRPWEALSSGMGW